MLPINVGSLPVHFTAIDPDKYLEKLQLEPSHVVDASTLLAKVPPHERANIVDQVVTLKRIQMKNRGEILSSLTLLETLVRVPTSAQRSQVVSAIFDLFEEGVKGANTKEVLDLLALFCERNDFDRLIKIAKEWFFSFDLKETHKLILSANESDSMKNFHLCCTFHLSCINGLEAASEEIKTEGIQNLLNPLPEKEKNNLVETIKKLHSNNFEFQKTLQVLIGIPHEERSVVVDQVLTLGKILMSENEVGGGGYGFPLTSLEALKKLANISPAKRARVMEMLMDLFVSGVPGANETMVLDFLIKKSEKQLIPIIRIAKTVFFNFNDKAKNADILSVCYKKSNSFFGHATACHCINVLKCLAEIRGIENLPEETLIAFETLKNFEELKDWDDEDKIIYKILFSNERNIQQYAYDLPGQDHGLFCWMEKLIADSNNQVLQTCFKTWMKENAALVKFHHVYNMLMASYQSIKKLSSQKIFVGYFTELEKPFPKNLKATYTPQNKTCIKTIKSSIKYFLDYKFNSDNVENGTNIPPLNCFIFYLKNPDHTYDKYRTTEENSAVIKNDSKRINLRRNELELFKSSMIKYHLNGNRYETIESHQDKFLITSQKNTAKQPNEFWDFWQMSESNFDVYYNQIYPIICKAVLTILEAPQNNSTFPTILDIGGGAGHLARSIFNAYQKPLNYILLEKNDVQIGHARQSLGSFCAVVKTDIVEDSIYYQDEEKMKPLEFNSVDIAIASGVLTQQVLKDKEESLSTLKKICLYIKQGGFIILSGKAHSHIAASDLLDAGFEVINMSLPQSSTQFYIARKFNEQSSPLEENLS